MKQMKQMKQREILFRGQRQHEKEWVYGSFVRINDTGFPGTDEHLIYPHSGPTVIVIAETVTQYTGLKDLTKWEELTETEQSQWIAEHAKWVADGNLIPKWKGKKIFEGDIFDVTDGDGWEVGTQMAKMDADTLGIDRRCMGVIIGNRFDNPELLKQCN